VTFSIPAGDSWNVWEIAVSTRTGKVTGEPQRLTIGAGNDLRASCASGGALTFAKIDARSDVWLLPVELNHGRSAGAPQRMARGQPWHENPSLAQNGQVAFASDQSGRMNVWIRELATGKELSVAASPFVQRYPVSSASGGRIAFSAYEHDKRVVYVSVPGGAPDRVCEGCLRATDWSGDEKTLLVFGGAPYQVDMLDIGSHRRKALVKHPAYDLLYGRYSPDQKWVSFTARVQPALGRIVVAPADGPTPVDESAWRTIAEVGPEDYANWSPDGQTLYFSSGRDGYSCLWGQRVDASSMMPRGEAFALHHFHGRLSFKHGGWSAAAGRIAIPLVETTGNVWMMSRSGEP
jgi:Tol biopolymer transport system component